MENVRHVEDGFILSDGTTTKEHLGRHNGVEYRLIQNFDYDGLPNKAFRTLPDESGAIINEGYVMGKLDQNYIGLWVPVGAKFDFARLIELAKQ